MRRLGLIPGGLFLVLVGCVYGGDLAPPIERDPWSRCAEFETTEVRGGVAELVAEPVGDDGLPAYCRVRGIIEPSIRFEARLPLDGWNGKYYQSGCGGYCGAVLADKPGFSNSINEALKLGFATITTDNGHEGGLGDASWAEGNPEAVQIYAHRGIELTYDAGTRLTKAFYGVAPRRAYFGGCSNGGRMGAMAAQRYPTLFDGILSGAPVLKLSANGGIYGSWVVQANTDERGRRILTRANFADKLPALEKAVLAQCDTADGRADGLIGRPRSCEVDVQALPACAGGTSESCFTAKEKAVIARWYRGPRDSSGRQLYPGMPPGSERFWYAWFLDPAKGVAPGNALGGDYARYLGFPQRVGPDWSALDFDFDEDPAALRETAELLDATAPDLAAFRAAGGKLLMWHGWADPVVLPDQSVEYYRAVVDETGSDEAVAEFFRLFMIPGHGHCWELPATVPDRFNPIRVLENWVEKGEPPDVIMAEVDQSSGDTRRMALCPYPTLPSAPAEDRAQDAGLCRPGPPR